MNCETHSSLKFFYPELVADNELVELPEGSLRVVILNLIQDLSFEQQFGEIPDQVWNDSSKGFLRYSRNEKVRD